MTAGCRNVSATTLAKAKERVTPLGFKRARRIPGGTQRLALAGYGEPTA